MATNTKNYNDKLVIINIKSHTGDKIKSSCRFCKKTN